MYINAPIYWSQFTHSSYIYGSPSHVCSLRKCLRSRTVGESENPGGGEDLLIQDPLKENVLLLVLPNSRGGGGGGAWGWLPLLPPHPPPPISDGPMLGRICVAMQFVWLPRYGWWIASRWVELLLMMTKQTCSFPEGISTRKRKKKKNHSTY